MEKEMLYKLIGPDRRLTDEEKDEYIRLIVKDKLTKANRYERALRDFNVLFNGADYSFKTIIEYTRYPYAITGPLVPLEGQLESIRKIVLQYFRITDALILKYKKLSVEATKEIKIINDDVKNKILSADMLADIKLEYLISCDFKTVGVSRASFKLRPVYSYEVSPSLVGWIIWSLKSDGYKSSALLVRTLSSHRASIRLDSEIKTVEEIIKFYNKEEE